MQVLIFLELQRFYVDFQKLSSNFRCSTADHSHRTAYRLLFFQVNIKNNLLYNIVMRYALFTFYKKAVWVCDDVYINNNLNCMDLDTLSSMLECHI